MGNTLSPICTHCHTLVEKVDKPYCGNCGNLWNASAQSGRSSASSSIPTWLTSLNKNESLMSSLVAASERRDYQQESNGHTAPLNNIMGATSFSPTSDQILDRLRELQEKLPQSLSELQERFPSSLPTPQDKITQSLPTLRDRSTLIETTRVLNTNRRNEILEQLRSLQARLQSSEEIQRYFPLPGNTKLVNTWRQQVERMYTLVQGLEGYQFTAHQEDEIYKHLAIAVHQLNPTRTCKAALLGHAGAGTSTLLGALLGEEIFLRRFGTTAARIHTSVRFCAEDEQEKMYVHFQDATRPAEVFFRKEWNEIWSEFANTTSDGQPIAIKQVEFALHATAFFSVGSVLLELPGDEGDQPGQETSWDEALDDIDVLIFVVDSTRFHLWSVRHIVEQVQQKISLNRTPEEAARMLFLAATHWDGTNSEESLEAAVNGLQSLLPVLPSDFETYHHHGSGQPYFFYPLRAADALFATIGLQQKTVDADLQDEADRYVARVVTVYDKLKQLNPHLPAVFEAWNFRDVSREQHEAMLQLSSMPEMLQDLQHFLGNERYHTQLERAKTELGQALQLLENIGWERLNASGIHVSMRSMDSVEHSLASRKGKQRSEQRNYIARRIQMMQVAWNDALQQFEKNTSLEEQTPTAFRRELESAHIHAAEYVIQRIERGLFDSYFATGDRMRKSLPTLSIDRLGREVHLWELLGKLRLSLRVAIEEEIKKPARELAEAFLTPISQKEQRGGHLNLNGVSLGEFGQSEDDIQKRYQAIKRSIYQKAQEASLCMTVSELLSAERRLDKNSPSVSNLIEFVNSFEGSNEDFERLVHEHMKAILEEMHRQIAARTERPIIDYFRYELDKLDTYEVYDHEQNEEPSTEPGSFTTLVKDLEDQLVDCLRSSEEFRQKLNQVLYPDVRDAESWYLLLKKVKYAQNTETA